MRVISNSATFLIISFLLNSCIAQTPMESDAPPFWTKEKKAAYAARNTDPATWDSLTFQQDMDLLQIINWPTKPAISDFPSPVAKYQSPGGTIKNLHVKINGKNTYGFSVAWAKGEFNQHLFKDPKENIRIYFNILILTDDEKEESRAAQVISRNHPHYMSTGAQKTSKGKVDWVQMALANDDNYAIISQRFFDLNFGRTILVAPHKDGSIRFLQISSPNSFGPSFDQFLKNLETRQEVLDLFNDPEAID